MPSAYTYVVAPVSFTPSIADTRCRSMVSKSSYYFSNYWWQTKKGYPWSAGKASGIPTITWDATYANGVEINVREACNAAITMAVCADWGGYYSSAVTLTLSDIRLNAARLVIAASNAHFQNLAGGWGASWQSALWAYNLGLAGWLVWNSTLTNTADRQKLCNIIEFEANYQLDHHRPEIMYNASGTIMSAGSSIGGAYYSDGPQGLRVTTTPPNADSAMEEDIWNGTLLDFAATMMPTHPNAALWARRAAMYGVTGSMSYNDRNDTTTVVNGYSPVQWATGSGISGMSGYWNVNQSGYNLDANYIVKNHNKRNPDYMQAETLKLQCSLHHSLANQATPEWVKYNSERIYGVMWTKTMGAGYSFYYATGQPDLYYPDGADWGPKRYTGYWMWDSFAETHITGPSGTTSLIPVSPTSWDGWHGNAAVAMQNRTGIMPGGQIVLNDSEDSYPGREGWHASSAAYIVLNKALTNAGRLSWSTATL